MTKTIDEQLERLASAQERSAAALEGILETVSNFKFGQAEQVVSVTVADTHAPEAKYAKTPDEAATEEAQAEETPEEPKGPEAVEESEPGPQPEDTGDTEEPAETKADGEDGDKGDPLGDGDAAKYKLPNELTNDTLRGFARDLMEKDGKAAVFEVLAETGSGYKAVGEVKKDDLLQAHKLMLTRLTG